MKTKEELYKKLRELPIEISDVQKEKVLPGDERKHEAILNNLRDLYNRTLDTLISKIRKDDIDGLVEWLGSTRMDDSFAQEIHDEYLIKYKSGYNQALSDIIEHLQELKEKIWNQK